MRGNRGYRSALPALLTGAVLLLPLAAQAGPSSEALTNRASSPMMFDDSFDAMGDPESLRPPGQTFGMPSANVMTLGNPQWFDLRIGPLIVYNNTFQCDPNSPQLIDVNETTTGGLVDFTRSQCANQQIASNCDPNSCDIPGPFYIQDSGTSISAEVNGFRFVYYSDHNTGAGGAAPDFDGDGDVDLGDFANFSLCFAGANNPPAGSCPGGVDADFDNDGDVDLGDFANFSLCFAGANNPPAGSCALILPGGNPIDMNICFSQGTNTGSPNATGSIIVDDFSGSGGSTASRALYTCVGLPGDSNVPGVSVPGDGIVTLVEVEVDLEADPPIWTASRPTDSMVFTGAVLKESVVPATADRTFNLLGGAFGLNIGSDDNTIQNLFYLSAGGGSGNQNVFRVLEQSQSCDTNTNPCGTPFTPDFTVLYVDPSNGNCTFDNCVNCPNIDNAGVWFVIESASVVGEPNETIDPNLPTAIVNAGCFTTTAEIGAGAGATDVDMYKITVTSIPGGTGVLKLVAYAEGVGTPPNRGNPYLRVFDSIGTELGANDSDGRPENSDLACQPHAGVNALVNADITSPGDYYIAVSGGGSDVWLSAADPVSPCTLDPNGVANDNYDPISGSLGNNGVEGVYALTIGVGDITPSGFEPNDDFTTAEVVGALPFDTGDTRFFGDGPFGSCLGDHDYFYLADAVTTDGNAMDSFIISNLNGVDSSPFMMVFETDAGSTTTGVQLVAVNDNSSASFDARTLTPVNAGKDYYVMVLSTGDSTAGTRSQMFRMFGGFVEFEPGLDHLEPGAGDAWPGAVGSVFTGTYRLVILDIALPAQTGPAEPNDSVAEAAANAAITVQQNQSVSASMIAFMGDGRYGWSVGTLTNPTIGDTDIFRIVGLDVNDTLEAVASPQGVSTVQLFNFVADEDQIIDASDFRLTFPNTGVSSQTLTVISDPNQVYVVVTPGDSRLTTPFFGELLPWDTTIPGTLLNGNFSGQYNIAVKARSLPPTAVAGSRMWGAFRNNTSASILELNPNTGTIVSSFTAPSAVNGAATGLAFAASPPGYTSDVLFYLNTQGALVQFSRLYSLDPNTGTPDTSVTTLGFYNLNAEAALVAAFGGTGNLTGATDGLGYAGTKLWLINQNADVLAEFDTDGPNNARTGNTYPFTGSPFFRQCRDGLEGTDVSTLGTGHVLYVAARENNTIVLVDVGANGDGPADDDVLVNLGEIPDPTFQGGAGNANTGAIAVLPLDGGGGAQTLYAGNINTFLTDTTGAEDLGVGTVTGGWTQPDFGASGYTGTSP